MDKPSQATRSPERRVARVLDMKVLTGFYFLVWMAVLETEGCEHLCSSVDCSGHFHFCKNQAGSDVVRVDHSASVTCCASEFEKITWYEFSRDGSKTELALGGSTSRYQLCQKDQVLHIPKVKLEDKGTYQCMAENNTTTNKRIYKNFTLDVVPCKQLIGSPEFTIKPNNQQYASLGQRLDLECEGDFGCGDQQLTDVLWFQYESSEKRQYLDPDFHGPYQIINYNKRDRTVHGSNLTIFSVSKFNFSHLIQCELSAVSTRKDTNVTILQQDVSNTVETWVIIVITLGCFMLILVLGLAVVSWLLWKPQMIFWIYTKFNRLPRRGDFDYDATVLYGEENQTWVSNTFGPNLKKYGHRIFLKERDLPPNSPETIGEANILTRSYCVLVVLSESDLKENSFHFLLRSAAEAVGGQNMIIIKRGNISKDKWKEVPQDLVSKLKVMLWTDWPDEKNNSKRKFDNVWCTIRRKLPKVRAENHSEGTKNRSSETPLLEDECVPIATDNLPTPDVFSVVNESANNSESVPEPMMFSFGNVTGSDSEKYRKVSNTNFSDESRPHKTNRYLSQDSGYCGTSLDPNQAIFPCGIIDSKKALQKMAPTLTVDTHQTDLSC